MEIFCVQPQVWRSYEQTRLEPLGEKERASARALLTEFHNRHIGIPVGLVVSLLTALNTPMAATRLNSPWKEVRKRLESELIPDRKAGGLLSHGGISLSAAPAYFIRRVALPLVYSACQVIGKCFLFSDDEEASETVTVKELDQYEAEISFTICRLADADIYVKAFDLFWTERAAALSTYSSPVLKRKSLPNPDPLAAAFTLRLDALPRNIRNYEHLERIHLRRNRHQTRQLREEGVAGITQTRSLDVIHNILISELINPDVLLADRLMNTGYLVTERLPKRERLRDALIIAFLPPEMQQRPSADFLRACWLNLSSVLFQVLLNNHLHDSQIMFIEGEHEASFHICSISVDELRFAATRARGVEITHSAAFRKGFLNLTRWLPEFMDRRKEKHYLRLEAGREFSGPVDWLGQVWRTQFTQQRIMVEGHQNQSRSPKVVETTLQLEKLIRQFAYVHVTTFLPVDIVPGNERENLRTCSVARHLYHELEAGEHEGFYQSVNWVNNQSFIKDDEPVICDFFGAAHSHQLSWGGSLATGDLASAAQELEQVWLEEIVREMQRD